MSTPAEVLQYWLGDLDQSPAYFEKRTPFWFWGGEKVDEEIREKFGALLERAARGELNSWAATPKGALALIIVLDQFALNLYREKPPSYQYSEKAIPIARKAIEAGWEWVYTPAEKLFLYLPFEHAENLKDQNYCVARFENLVRDVPAAFRDVAEGYLDYARRHQRVVAKYGRFPDRNEVFGRKSTPEEEAFLASDAAPF